MSATIGAPVPTLRKLIDKRKVSEGFQTDSEYLRWLIRRDLKQAGLLGKQKEEPT